MFETEFSTSTDVDRIASLVALMDTFQPYFDYVLHCVCGIPSVILEGGTEDWRLLKSKVECLDASDLELSWWTKPLLPLCDQFVRAADGHVDRSHWRNLCKVINRYGVEDLNGWLLKFIPYLRHGKNEPATHRNPVLEMNVFFEPTGTREEANGNISGCTSDMLPGGLSRAPVKWVTCETGKSDSLEFVAGLMGVTQSPEDLSLRAMTGWAICEGAAIDRAIARLRVDHETAPPMKIDPEQFENSVFKWNLPADVWRFYSETNGAVVTLPGARGRCRILPLEEIKPVWDIQAFQNELREVQGRGGLSMGELQAQYDFNNAYGRLVRIAELGNGHWFAFGGYPEIHRGLSRRARPWPSRAEREARAVFLWTGERIEESFTFAAPSFIDWLASLIEGENFQSKVFSAE